jgi:hypothetical protein
VNAAEGKSLSSGGLLDELNSNLQEGHELCYDWASVTPRRLDSELCSADSTASCAALTRAALTRRRVTLPWLDCELRCADSTVSCCVDSVVNCAALTRARQRLEWVALRWFDEQCCGDSRVSCRALTQRWIVLDDALCCADSTVSCAALAWL